MSNRAPMHTYSKVSRRFFSYIDLKWLVSAFMYTNIFSTGYNNRYPTIRNVVYITTIPPIVCICLVPFQREVSDPPSQPPGMTRCTALNVDSHFFFSSRNNLITETKDPPIGLTIKQHLTERLTQLAVKTIG